MAFQQLKLGDQNRVINNFYLAHLNDGSKFTVQQSPVEWGDIPNILPYVPTSPPQGWPAPPLGQTARPNIIFLISLTCTTTYLDMKSI